MFKTTFLSSSPSSATSLDIAAYQAALVLLGQRVNMQPTLFDLFQEATSVVAQMLQVDCSYIWQLCSDGNSVQLAANSRLLVAMAGNDVTPLPLDTIVDITDQSVFQALLAMRQPLVVSAGEAMDTYAELFPPDAASGLLLLITHLDQPLGILAVCTAQALEFTVDEVNFLQSITHILATAIQQRQFQRLVSAQTEILELVARNSSLVTVLEQLCYLLEQELPGALCSILLADTEQRCLGHGVGPSLDPEYSAGLEGLLFGPCSGSCGTAAYRGEPVFVDDIATDPLWVPFRDFALHHNIRACWSSPFFSKSGEVIGTFAISHRTPCSARPYHYEVHRTAVHLASIAVEAHRNSQALQQMNEQLEQQVEARTQELQLTLQELQQAQARLIQSEKMSGLGRMVAGIAHEVNNPLTFIAGNLVHVDHAMQDLLGLITAYQQVMPQVPDALQQKIEAIELDFLQSDLPRMLGAMKTGSQRIRDIVLALRNFSHLDEASYKKVDIHEGIESTLLLLEHRLNYALPQGPIRCTQHWVELPRMRCYANQLNQVFFNILTNAIEALQDTADPEIVIRTEHLDAGHIAIVICNNGLRIPAAILPQIFDPFFTTKTVGQGIGMGLAIAYQIVVEQHQGCLTCESSEEATQFRIVLPLH